MVVSWGVHNALEVTSVGLVVVDEAPSCDDVVSFTLADVDGSSSLVTTVVSSGVEVRDAVSSADVCFEDCIVNSSER